MKTKILSFALIILFMFVGGYYFSAHINTDSQNEEETIYSSSSEENVHEKDNSTVHVFAEYPLYDKKSLTNKASDIVSGVIVDRKVVNIDINEDRENASKSTIMPYTVFTVSLDEVYKGKYEAGKNIEIKQLGGTTGDVMHNSEFISLSDGINYVFFLESYKNVPASLLNMHQSVYIYDENNELKSLNSSNDITFTYSELQSISN